MWCSHLKPWCTHSNKTTTRTNEFRAKCYRKHICESQHNSRAHGFVPDQVVSRRAYGADCSGKPCRKQHHTWMTIFFFHLVGHSRVRSFRNSTVVAPLGSKLALKMRRHDHRATGGSKIKPWRSLWLQAAVHTEVAAAEAPAPGATRLRADLAKDAAAYATRPLNQSALLRPLWSSAVMSAPPRQ